METRKLWKKFQRSFPRPTFPKNFHLQQALIFVCQFSRQIELIVTTTRKLSMSTATAKSSQSSLNQEGLFEGCCFEILWVRQDISSKKKPSRLPGKRLKQPLNKRLWDRLAKYVKRRCFIPVFLFLLTIWLNLHSHVPASQNAPFLCLVGWHQIENKDLIHFEFIQNVQQTHD